MTERTATDRDFVRVLGAEGVSNFGSMLSRLAIPFLAALALAATPLQMSLLLVADVLAAALGSLWLGAWVDRSGKRAVMLACDGLRALVLAALALGAWTGSIGFVSLLAASAFNGMLTMGFELARSAWMAQAVAAGDLPRRNAQLSVAGSLSETLAFAAGGWLYQGLGAALSLAVDALSYLASALCLTGVREQRAVPAPSSDEPHGWRGLLDEAMAGLRVVAGHPSLRTIAGIEVLVAAGISLTGSCVMVFVTRDLGFETGPLGMIFAFGGLGAVAGGALAPWLGRRVGAGRAMAIGLALLAVGSAFTPMATQAGLLAMGLLAAQQIVGDCGHVVHEVHDRTLRQTSVPEALLARADAGIRAAGQCATLAGALVGGVIGTWVGTRSVLVLAAGLFAVAAWQALRRLAPRHPAA